MLDLRSHHPTVDSRVRHHEKRPNGEPTGMVDIIVAKTASADKEESASLARKPITLRLTHPTSPPQQKKTRGEKGWSRTPG